jgi:hypothetical protein
MWYNEQMMSRINKSIGIVLMPIRRHQNGISDSDPDPVRHQNRVDPQRF